MDNEAIKKPRPLKEIHKKLFVFLALTVISALVMTIVECRDTETWQISLVLISNFSFFLVFFATLYAMPLLTGGYRVLVPSIATAFLIFLLIASTPVHMRMILEADVSALDQAFSYISGAGLALLLSLLYTVCGGLLTWDAKKEGLPPLFHSMSKKAYRILYGILIGVLLITGVTTSIIHESQMAELNAYAVSEDDYPTVMPNLRVVADIGEPEIVSHGWDRITYSAIDGVDYHEFLYAEQHEGILWGGVTYDPIILRAKDNTTDPAANAPIKEITLTGKIDVTMTPALKAEIEKIVRGQGTPYKGETEPNKYTTSYTRAHSLTVSVSFEGYDAFVWSAPVVEFEGHYLLQVETRTDFTNKKSIFEHTYAYFELTEPPLPAGEETGN